jgi:lipoprotein-anchoring transpeptidase ErfK/SrfK
MKFALKVGILFFVLPSALFAQPGVRMSADFLPLEVGNRWVYDVFNESGQKTGALDFAVQDRRIVDGRSFYAISSFPFVAEGDAVKLIRYDREERQYVRIADNREDPLFLADGAKVDVLQADPSGLPQKFLLKMDLMDLTFQRGMGIIEARLHAGKDVQIVKLASVHTGEHQAEQAAAQGAPALPQPNAPATPEQKVKSLADNVVKPSEANPALDVQVSSESGGTKFVLTVVNTSEKLLPFNFKSSQTYDFEVLDASTGQEVWRWSRRMFFSQVIRQEAIRGTRNWVFEVTWNHRDNDLNVVPPGQYKVIGILAAEPSMESDPVSFEVR